MQGFAEAQRNFSQGYVNRILLLSDGLANAGVVDPAAISAEARRIRARSISVSAMGVGVDYNENLMANIADNSGGNYYYIRTDVNMAEIFHKEWNLMQSLIATDAVARLRLGREVKVVDVAGFQWEQNGRDVAIQVPDIYSGQARRILVELQAPADSIRNVQLATGTFICKEVFGNAPRKFTAEFRPEIRVIEDRTVVAANLDKDVNSKAAGNIASRKMEIAYEYFEKGETEKAYKLADDTAQQLRALGYVQNEAQVKRYDSALQAMQPAAAPPPDSATGKDFLKKQKEAERAAQQSDPQ
jgi:Ca-activated chloride channel family protein